MATKHIGLFFGSFNPIHVGHLSIANFVANSGQVEEVWFVISPQSPFKTKKSLLSDHHRLQLVQVATESNPKLSASNIEFGLPKPSYTIDTLVHLKEKFPKKEFTLIMGEDNIKSFHKWKNYKIILRDYKVLVYPRTGVDDLIEGTQEVLGHKNVSVLKDVPTMQISASYIRKKLGEGESVQYLLTPPVLKYAEEMGFYR